MITAIKPPAKTAVPCIRCGTTGGWTAKDRAAPLRRRTDQWGLPGLCCSICAQTVKHAFLAARKPVSHEREMPARERLEIAKRVAIVREAKMSAESLHGRTWLTDAELDAILPLGRAS